MSSTSTKLVFLFVCLLQVSSSPAQFNIPIDLYLSNPNPYGGTPATIPFLVGQAAKEALYWGLEDALLYNDNILPNTTIELLPYDCQRSKIITVNKYIQYSEQNMSFAAGYTVSSLFRMVGKMSTVYDSALVSALSTGHDMSNKTVYPYLSRLVPSSDNFFRSSIAFLAQYRDQYGPQWGRIAVLSTSSEYGIDYTQLFIEVAQQANLTVLSYQQILPFQLEASFELQQIKESGARVIVSLVEDHVSFGPVFANATALGLIGPSYVWVLGEIHSASEIFRDFAGNLIPEMVEALRGSISTLIHYPRNGTGYERFADHWVNDGNPAFGAGSTSRPQVFSALYYDLGYMLPLIVDQADKMGILDTTDRIPAQTWTNIIRQTTFEGSTGKVELNQHGDRVPVMDVVNFRSDANPPDWFPVGTWTPEGGLVMFDEIIWNDNTTNIPDLDVRPPFHYWSCDKGERRYDETGKTVELHTPDGGDSVDDIDSAYECDMFIDCRNLSDEGWDCEYNYPALFVAYGIVTGILIFVTLLFIPFVIIFGYIVVRRRVRYSSPLFLLVIIVAGILGYISTFAWYGQPHTVGCNFQPWLLGLAVVAMISALSAKAFRIWRIYKSPFKRVVITDWELVILWLVMVLPAVLILILWTIISTPTATIVDRDGKDHFLCETGGFTGPPGGMVFFFILVGYEALVGLFAAFLSFVTRNVPSLLNESRLIAISIYNLVFLSIVVIPVVIVLRSINPFIEWIIRTTAILYAFTATLWLQFIPLLVGLIIVDRCKERNLIIDKKNLSNSGVSATNTFTQG